MILHVDKDSKRFERSQTFFSIPYQCSTRTAEEVLAIQDAWETLGIVFAKMRRGPVPEAELNAFLDQAVQKMKSQFSTADRNTRRKKNESEDS